MPHLRSLLFLFLLISLSGCGDEPLAPRSAPGAGDRTMTVIARVYDEFKQERESLGPIDVTLSGSDRVVHGSIPRAGASAVFYGLPSASYIVSAEKDGYYPYEIIAGARPGFSNWSPDVRLYPHPSPAFRIDSIAVGPDPSSSKYLRITLLAAESAPSSYTWQVVLYFSVSPSIDPTLGRYDDVQSAGRTGGGSVIALSVSKGTFSNYPFRGQRVYVTARLMTAASRDFFDSTTHKSVFTNLETNTKAVASFIPE